MKLWAKIAAGVAAWEGAWWVRRLYKRSHTYVLAQKRAAELKRPLVVVGAPDSGPTSGYGCGDVTVDIAPSACPAHKQVDITKPTDLASDSSVVFVSCVLEYVQDLPAAKRELLRIAGSPENLFVVGVEPWTLTAWLYPGTKHVAVGTGT